MSYEEKYKDALNKAKSKIWNDKGHVLYEDDIVEIFPELAESEDERISREITEFLVDFNNGEYERPNENTIDSWLSWLEKQGESIKIKKGKNYLCTKTHRYAGIEWREGIKYYSPEDYSLVNQGCTYYCPKYSKEEHNNFFEEVEYNSFLEIDNTKPKFNVGDWITNGEYTWKVTDIKSLDYILQSPIYGDTTDDTISYVDEHFHLWNINDAKAGDVLVFDDIIMIFKNIQTVCTANTYILYCDKIVVDDWCDFGHNAQPASKKQRDFLFQKMSEAGYKWDAEKKELIKNM